MNDFLNCDTVLRVNALQMRIGWSTPKEAFTMLMGGNGGEPPALALDIQYKYDEFGMPILNKVESMYSTKWEDWIELQPRQGDLDRVIHTSKRIIRIPTVIMCSHFHQMPKKEQKPTPTNIKKRDGNRCQYTGVPLTNKTFSLDHVIPKSKGGKNTWKNLVSAHKDINTRKGDKTNKEAGLKLLKQPIHPLRIPLCAIYTEIKHPDHAHF